MVEPQWENENRNRLLRYYGLKDRQLERLQRNFESYTFSIFLAWFTVYFILLLLQLGTDSALAPRAIGILVFMIGGGLALAGFDLGRHAGRLEHLQLVLQRIERLLGIHPGFSFRPQGQVELTEEERLLARSQLSIYQWFFTGRKGRQLVFAIIYYGAVVQMLFGLVWTALYWRFADNTSLEQICFISLVASLPVGLFLGYLLLFFLDREFQAAARS